MTRYWAITHLATIWFDSLTYRYPTNTVMLQHFCRVTNTQPKLVWERNVIIKLCFTPETPFFKQKQNEHYELLLCFTRRLLQGSNVWPFGLWDGRFNHMANLSRQELIHLCIYISIHSFIHLWEYFIDQTAMNFLLVKDWLNIVYTMCAMSAEWQISDHESHCEDEE